MVRVVYISISTLYVSGAQWLDFVLGGDWSKFILKVAETAVRVRIKVHAFGFVAKFTSCATTVCVDKC